LESPVRQDHILSIKEISMKHIPTLANTILAIVMLLILLTTDLPNFNARAATQTPEPQVTQEENNPCNNSRTV